MPGGDQTGPPGGGGRGSGRGIGRGGSGQGRMKGNRLGAGPGGNCVCPQCGTKSLHKLGVPCYSVSCPKCGTKMTRG